MTGFPDRATRGREARLFRRSVIWAVNFMHGARSGGVRG